MVNNINKMEKEDNIDKNPYSGIETEPSHGIARADFGFCV